MLVLAVAAGTGCGVATRGTATVWVTRDRGAQVLLTKTVPAGLTAMQALERVAQVSTRYAGRYVQSIDGVAGSLSKQRDWFYFVNGYEADRSAAEYRLHQGDVEWWDFRSWKTSIRQAVVVGAFPEPFLHGYDGRRLPAVVAGPPGKATRMLARLLHARRVVVLQSRGVPLAGADENVLRLVEGRGERFEATLQEDRPGSGVRFTYVGDVMKLARNPSLARYRYSLP